MFVFEKPVAGKAVGFCCYGSGKSARRKMAVRAHLLRGFLKPPGLFGTGVAPAKPGCNALKFQRDPLEFGACAIQPIDRIVECGSKVASHCKTVPWASTVVAHWSSSSATSDMFSAYTEKVRREAYSRNCRARLRISSILIDCGLRIAKLRRFC